MSHRVDRAERSSSGLEPNVAGLLCYFAVFLLGIYFLVTEKRSSFVRFHAMQSTITFLVLAALQAALVLLGFGLTLAPLVGLVSGFVWLLLMSKAYSWETYRLPLVGKIAEKELLRDPSV